MNEASSGKVEPKVALALMASLALMVALALVPSTAVAAPELGKPAPGFELRDGSGTLFRLADSAYPGPTLAHRPKAALLIDFFRTDCAPCRKTLPKLVELHRKYQGRRLRVVLIALLEEDEGQRKLDAFLRKNPLPFTVLIDAYGVAGRKYVRKGSGLSIPATFLVDENGLLRARFKAIDDKVAKQLRAALARHVR